MKLFLTILLSAAATPTWAACNPNPEIDDGVCAVNSGECSRALTSFFDVAEKGIPAASTVPLLKYGKFCGGGSNKCPGLNNANDASNSGGRDIVVEACSNNNLDQECKDHDSCLDNAGRPGSGPIPLPDRCPCDLSFVASLATVALGGGRLNLVPGVPELPSFDPPGFDPPSEELCDEGFYDTEIDDLGGITYSALLSLQGLSRSPEAVGLAAPFCGVFTSGGVCNDRTLAEYDDYAPVLNPAEWGIDDVGVAEVLCNIISIALS